MSQNNPLRALLDKQDILLLDGAMATELEARGCNLADSLWSAKVLVETRSLSAKCILITTGRGAMRDHCQLSGDAGGLRRARSG